MTAAATNMPSSLPTNEGRWSRWSDRLNAILVREVQQAVKGRLFSITILLALLITVLIATTGVGRLERGQDGGRTVFDAGLATLAPLVLFIVPMQAYQSMRMELRGGIVEQLLLSRLRPGAILFGKLQAAMVQFLLYVAVLSPLLATSYLLRGVDLATIGISLLFAMVFCMVATAFAISSAAQGMAPLLQPIANLATAMGLGIGTFAAIGFVGSGQYARSIGWLWSGTNLTPVVSGILLAALLSAAMSLLIAQSYLLHAFENRCTPFRVFLFVCPALAFAWMALFLPAGAWDVTVPTLTVGLLLLGTVFALFMVTEQQRLSPRVQAHVPQNPAIAALVSPFLPGRDRALVCYWLYVVVLGLVASWLWPAASRIPLHIPERMIVMSVGYAVCYLAMLRWIRARLPDTMAANHLGRFMVPVLIVGGCLLPALIDLFARGDVQDWHLGHVLNPFWTTAEALEMDALRWQEVASWVKITVAVLLVLQLPRAILGVREVLTARQRLAESSHHA